MKRTCVDHPKFQTLQLALGLNKWEVIGLLEALWHFTARYAPEGDIGRWTDREIAAWLEWKKDPAELVAALIDCRWLDRSNTHRLLVHDWADHADDATKVGLKRHRKSFIVPGRGDGVATSSHGVATCRDMSPLACSQKPEPEPVTDVGSGTRDLDAPTEVPPHQQAAADPPEPSELETAADPEASDAYTPEQSAAVEWLLTQTERRNVLGEAGFTTWEQKRRLVAIFQAGLSPGDVREIAAETLAKVRAQPDRANDWLPGTIDYFLRVLERTVESGRVPVATQAIRTAEPERRPLTPSQLDPEGWEAFMAGRRVQEERRKNAGMVA